jgi:hypothetical protein
MRIELTPEDEKKLLADRARWLADRAETTRHIRRVLAVVGVVTAVFIAVLSQFTVRWVHKIERAQAALDAECGRRKCAMGVPRRMTPYGQQAVVVCVCVQDPEPKP